MASVSSCCATFAGNLPVSSAANVLPGGQPRGAAQPRDPALTARFGFRLEHLDQHRHRLGVARLRQPRDELLGRRRQPELRQQRRHLRARRRHPTGPPVSSASYCARSGRGMRTTGMVVNGREKLIIMTSWS